MAARARLLENQGASRNHTGTVCRFELQREDQVLGLPIGQHLDMQGLTQSGETVIKPYTVGSSAVHGVLQTSSR